MLQFNCRPMPSSVSASLVLSSMHGTACCCIPSATVKDQLPVTRGDTANSARKPELEALSPSGNLQ